MSPPHSTGPAGPARPSEQADQPTPVDLRDYVQFDLRGAAGRRVLATDVVALDLVCLEPGQAVDARTLPTADAIYSVLGGVAWVVTDDAEVTLEPLQAVLVPAGVPHALRNDGADPLILQVVVSPPEDVPAPQAQPTPLRPARQRAGRRSFADRLRRTRRG